MAKLNDIIKQRPCKYTDIDMACLKQMEAARNSQVNRGELKREAVEYIVCCVCGVEGCAFYSART